MQSVEMLIDALNKYKGTLIIVSHDRYFISKTANKIWNIEEGEIKEFNGPYEEWHTWHTEKLKKEAAAAQATVAAKPEKKEEKPAPKPQVDNSQLNALKKDYQKLQKTIQKQEEDIARMKKETAALEAKLGDPAFYNNRDEFQKVDNQYRQMSTKLAEANSLFEKNFEQLMELEEKIS
jgi:ATP-binding cassette subfamily F protein 3